MARKWKCWKCGACCRVAGFIDKEFDRGDGVCKALDSDNECTIYPYRPEVCRVGPERTDDELFTACRRLEDFVYGEMPPRKVPQQPEG